MMMAETDIVEILYVDASSFDKGVTAEASA